MDEQLMVWERNEKTSEEERNEKWYTWSLNHMN